jgi:DNA-binding MarR family transcriptional regulator
MATGPAEEAWELFWRLMVANKPRIFRLSQELDLSPMQLHALRMLEPGGELPMRALADVLACDPSNVTGIVDRLELRGLIERREAAHDRRVKMLSLTPEGERFREAALARMLQAPPEIAALSREDQRALRDLLRRALETAEAPERVPAAGSA